MIKKRSSQLTGFVILFTLLFSAATLLILTGPFEPEQQSSAVGTIGSAESEPYLGLDTLGIARHHWLGAGGEPLPFENHEDIVAFLETAKVVSRKRIAVGINGIDKLLLEKDGVRAHAAFRNVRVHRPQIRLADGTTHFNFRDDCMFEVAAYRLSRMLGLENVPPAVRRKVYGNVGTLQLWVEQAMSEKERQRRDEASPLKELWLRQVQTMYLFDQLISNDDRNQGNILIDNRWKLWMIDHTRAFRGNKKPRTPQIVVKVDGDIFENLKALRREDMSAAMKGVLTRNEIKSVLERRAALVNHIEQRILRLGQDEVLF